MLCAAQEFDIEGIAGAVQLGKETLRRIVPEQLKPVLGIADTSWCDSANEHTEHRAEYFAGEILLGRDD